MNHFDVQKVLLGLYEIEFIVLFVVSDDDLASSRVWFMICAVNPDKITQQKVFL